VEDPQDQLVDLRRLVTVAEAADYLACSQSHVYDLVAEGKMPGVIRLGNAIRIDLRVFAQAVESS